MKKIISLIKASPVAVVIAGLVIVGVASAALVDYLSKTLVSENVPIASPIEIIGGSPWDWNIGHGGNADITLLRFKNRAEVPITGTAELAVEKWDGTAWVPFIQPGMQLAVSTDIRYAWAPGAYPPGDWRAWLSANPNWMNWVLSDPHGTEYLVRYNTTEISPLTMGPANRDGVLGYCHESGDPDGTRDLRTEITWYEDKGAWMIPNLTIPPASTEVPFVPVAVWIVTYPEIEPGTYRFSLITRPKTAE